MPRRLTLMLVTLAILAGCAPKPAPMIRGERVGTYQDGTPVYQAPRIAGAVQTSATADMGPPLPAPPW